MSARRLILGALLVFLVTLCIVALTELPDFAAAATTTSPTSQPNGTIVPPGGYRISPSGSSVTLPLGPISAINGLPAIVPTVANANATTPAFAQQDAINYVKSHAAGSKLIVKGGITVSSVQFLTAKAASTFLGRSIPLDDARLICIVQIAGNFTILAPSGGKDATLTIAFEVFDAHTGNTLMTIA